MKPPVESGAWRFGALALVVAVIACGGSDKGSEAVRPQIADGHFAPLPDRMPGSEKDTPEQVALGRMLYNDPILSVNNSQSCNSCHRIDYDMAGVDYKPTSTGARGDKGGRNAPTVLNAGYQHVQFWDGRAPDLVAQAAGPPLNPIEMGMPDSTAIVDRLRNEPQYKLAFAKAYPNVGQPITFSNTRNAIAAFERTLRTPGRLDDFLTGDETALTPAEQAGMQKFVDLGCTTCHTGPLIGGDRMQKMGMVHAYEVSSDTGAGGSRFKVPQLRNVTLTPPYFHDGRAGTVTEAVDRMAWLQLGKQLTPAEILQLARFLTTTADSRRTVSMSWKDTEAWSPRDPATVPAGPAADGLRYLSDARALAAVTGTASAGAAARGGEARAASGNALSCTNCHQDLGTKKYGLPWVGVTSRYPAYSARSGKQSDLPNRINGCMERSMNAAALPANSPAMSAMVAYMTWLSDGVPKDITGAGTPSFTRPERAANLTAGEIIYRARCQSCHGADGAGYLKDGQVVVPPLWGDGSYNDAAGMARLLTAAPFIMANMPLGTPWNRPALNEREAYDVAAFVNSHERPKLAGKERDYPNLLEKPIDAPYPPFADTFSVDQHRIGPYAPIEAAQRQIKARQPRVPNPSLSAAQ